MVKEGRKSKVGSLRKDTKARDELLKELLNTYKLRRVYVKVKNNRREPVLIHKATGRRVAWLAPRNKYLFGAYLFCGNKRIIKRVYNNNDVKSVKEWIGERVSELNDGLKTRGG